MLPGAIPWPWVAKSCSLTDSPAPQQHGPQPEQGQRAGIGDRAVVDGVSGEAQVQVVGVGAVVS